MSYSTSLTVITVVKDDPNGFQLTVDSLAHQDSQDFELIVIDSSSNTLEIKRILDESSFSDSIDVTYQWVSPEGIYSAMNQGLAFSQGEYVYFLNAGDQLDSPHILRTVIQHLNEKQATWLFGPVVMLEPDGSAVQTPTWNYQAERANFFARGLFPPHQGTFASLRAINECGGFDADYSISADYALFLKLSLLADPVIVDFPIARFTTGGLSSQQWRESFVQFHHARVEVLQPSGLNAVRERFWTKWHYTKVWIYRELIDRARR